MPLSVEDRGFFETIIDVQIRQIPQYIQFARDENVKKGLMLNNDYDFVMGQVFAYITSSFSSYYSKKLQQQGRIPSPEEFLSVMQEATTILIRRIAEVRKAIFDCG